jgi:sporulation protein YlmC with PRC-barrel domain
MTKKLMLSTAIGALMISGALAQSPPPSSSTNATPPPAAASPPPAAQQSDVNAKQSDAKAQQSGGKADIVISQKPDQWLASKFNGTDVMGADNKKIGDISDVLFDKTGKIEAYVVSVGGFLGMGAKEIALAPSSFEVIAGSNGKADVLKLSMTQDELKQAQNFARYEAPHATTTGSGGGLNSLGSRPGGNAMKPSSNTPPAGK